MFPAVWALLLALVMRSVPIPEVVGNGLALLASMVAPLIMLSVGLSLRFSELGRDVRAISVVSVLRLVVAPAIAFGIGSLVLGRGVPLSVTTLEAGMPTMMLTLVVGDRFGLDTDFIASAIFVTTALCSPSRASILTGVYAHRHGIVDNNTAIPPGTTFFPGHLQKAGYKTGFFGKWHMLSLIHI